ncbi:MAG TPA: hypothetical protein VHN98_10745 [Acidimicrobiales bacterium]|nr:hypothetical protein [Acidimicrobiales bacterium]
MGASASLTPASVTVVPGSEAAAEIRVRNTGSVVDEFTIDVVGDAAAWATVEPPQVSLFPGADATARVVFRPPRDASVAAGSVPFGVRVASKEDAAGSITEEGTIEVGAFALVTLELVPRTVRGRKAAATEIAIDNRGNAPANLTLSAGDADKLLAFDIADPGLALPPGTAAFSKLRIRPVSRFRRGPAQTRMYHVVAEQDGQPVATADGMMMQEATEPPWLRKAVMWSILGLLLLVGLWFLLLKPTVRSAAKDAVKQESAPVTIGPNSGKSSSGGSGSGSSGSGGTTPTTAGGDATGGGGVGTPIDGRLALTESGDQSFAVPNGKVLQLTDIVLQNPAGNTGMLQIRRDDGALLVVELGNFRDLDYHFVAPIVFKGGQKLVLSASCTSPSCTPGAYFAGFIAAG